MSRDIMEQVIIDQLKYFLGLNDSDVEQLLLETASGIKERVETIDDLRVIIYPKDHVPPHFHVKSKNCKIDAKFTIEKCELISGDISSKNLKKIQAFANSQKGRMTLEMVWKRYHG